MYCLVDNVYIEGKSSKLTLMESPEIQTTVVASGSKRRSTSHTNLLHVKI